MVTEGKRRWRPIYADIVPVRRRLCNKQMDLRAGPELLAPPETAAAAPTRVQVLDTTAGDAGGQPASLVPCPPVPVASSAALRALGVDSGSGNEFVVKPSGAGRQRSHGPALDSSANPKESNTVNGNASKWRAIAQRDRPVAR